MTEALRKTILIYADEHGREPFQDWLHSLKDATARARVRRRLDRVELGNYGDYAPVGDGVYELRLFFGAGYRIYFGEVGDLIVLLLCGGDKKTQKRDIVLAKTLWKDYEESER